GNEVPDVIKYVLDGGFIAPRSMITPEDIGWPDISSIVPKDRGQNKEVREAWDKQFQQMSIYNDDQLLDDITKS
ncbi:MAG: hypothetical protein AAF639_44850, partial [Chloroflexota bacterium]